MHYLVFAQIFKNFVKLQIAFSIRRKTPNSRYHPARARFMVNKACDWLSDESSKQKAWPLSKKKVPWKLIVSGAILIKFRLLVVSKLIVDSSKSRHF